ncbi:hypothetical protein, partial [Hahella sp. CCB-MM4]|uniref:hypothetical protein n=1 Tax=Hahella sp. (strain CCB-MM4) TaxID=1926491 RepID=UPI001AEF5B0B
GQGLLESFSETCVHCNGRGVIVHMEQPTSAGGGGGGKKSRKRGRGGAAQDHEHAHDHGSDDHASAEPAETEAELAAERAAPGTPAHRLHPGRPPVLGGGPWRGQEVHAPLADAGADDGPGLEVGELHDLVRDFLAEQADGPYGVEVDADVA